MEVVIGSYDSLVAGYWLLPNTPEDPEDSLLPLKLKQRFADVSHKGCVKCLAINNKGILASGSSDETIKLFDLDRGIDVGSLVSHEGDVTCLRYVGKDFLYSGSADGTIRMWRARIWELQRTFKGHKGAVLSFDIHPSKKLALSLGSDKKMIVWDLVAGKYSFVRNMKKLCGRVQFNKSGTNYVIISDTSMELFDLATAKSVYTEDLKSHINDVSFVTDDLCLTASDSGLVHIFSVSERKVLMKIEAHASRVRCISAVSTTTPEKFILISCSSDQTVKAWLIDVKMVEARCIASARTGIRITCLAVRSASGAASDLLDAVSAFSLRKVAENFSVESTAVEAVVAVRAGTIRKSKKPCNRLGKKPKL